MFGITGSSIHDKKESQQMQQGYAINNINIYIFFFSSKFQTCKHYIV